MEHKPEARIPHLPNEVMLKIAEYSLSNNSRGWKNTAYHFCLTTKLLCSVGRGRLYRDINLDLALSYLEKDVDILSQPQIGCHIKQLRIQVLRGRGGGSYYTKSVKRKGVPRRDRTVQLNDEAAAEKFVELLEPVFRGAATSLERLRLVDRDEDKPNRVRVIFNGIIGHLVTFDFPRLTALVADTRSVGAFAKIWGTEVPIEGNYLAANCSRIRHFTLGNEERLISPASLFTEINDCNSKKLDLHGFQKWIGDMRLETLGLQGIHDCPNPNNYQMTGTRLLVSPFKNMTNLRELKFMAIRFGDSLSGLLPHLTSLRVLHMRCCKILPEQDRWEKIFGEILKIDLDDVELVYCGYFRKHTQSTQDCNSYNCSLCSPYEEDEAAYAEFRIRYPHRLKATGDMPELVDGDGSLCTGHRWDVRPRIGDGEDSFSLHGGTGTDTEEEEEGENEDSEGEEEDHEQLV